MSLRHQRRVFRLERGYCLMIDGESEVVELLGPIFNSIAPEPGPLPAPRAGQAAPVPTSRATCIAARLARGTS